MGISGVRTMRPSGSIAGGLKGIGDEVVRYKYAVWVRI